MAGWFMDMPHATQNTEKHNALFVRVYVRDFLAKTRNSSTSFCFSVIIQCLIKTLGEKKRGTTSTTPLTYCTKEHIHTFLIFIEEAKNLRITLTPYVSKRLPKTIDPFFVMSKGG